MYKVVPTHQFERAYKRLNRKIQDQVDKTINLLMIDPRHPSLRTHKRKEDKTLWRTRVTSSYRLYFQMKGETITLLSVTAHKK